MLPPRQGHRRKAEKGFNLVCAKSLSMCAGSRFAKHRIVSKGFNWFVQSFRLYALIRGLENLEAPCKGDVFTFFLHRAKRTKKHARGLRTSGLRGRFKALSKKILAKFSDGTCRNRLFAQNGGEKALNRCERVTVVLTQDCEVSEMGCLAASSQ